MQIVREAVMSLANWMRGACLCMLLAVATVVHADPEVGWYWNPNESGRGFFVESTGGITYIGGYLYDDDGHALWLSAGSANADPYNFSGRLIQYGNGQSLYGSYAPPTA